MNIFYCDYDLDHEDHDDVKYVFNIYIAQKNSQEDIIKKVLKENKKTEIIENQIR